MTTTEDLVRDGLAGLAPQVPADEAAYRGVGRAITRRRRQRAVSRAAAVTLALVTAGGAALVVDRQDPSGYSTKVDDTTTTVVMRPDRITFGEATFALPVGWDVTTSDDTLMCIGPVEAADGDDCAVRLTRDDGVRGYEGFEPYRDHGDWSWYMGTDPMSCPGGAEDPEAPFDAVVPGDAGMGPIDSDERRVGDRTAVYDRWHAECTIADVEFEPQAWHLTDPEMLIVDVLGHPETEAILASFEFTDGGANG